MTLWIFIQGNICVLSVPLFLPYAKRGPSIRLYTKPWHYEFDDILLHYEATWSFCDGCDIPAGDTHSSGHFVASRWGLAFILIVEESSDTFLYLLSDLIPSTLLLLKVFHIGPTLQWNGFMKGLILWKMEVFLIHWYRIWWWISNKIVRLKKRSWNRWRTLFDLSISKYRIKRWEE